MRLPQVLRSRRVLSAAAGALLVLAVVLVVVLATRGDDGRTPSADAGPTTSAAAPTTAIPTTAIPTTAAPPASTPAPAPLPVPVPTEVAVAPDDVSQPPPTLPAVALDQPAEAGNGVTARLVALDAIDGTATGPGNIAGPALRVAVQLTNATGQPISLDAVTVTTSYGADATPASPLDDPSQAPFAGALADGAEAEGRYVFSVPADARDLLTVDVAYQPGLPVLQFSGPAR